MLLRRAVAACCCGVLLRRAVAACCCGVLLRRVVAACCCGVLLRRAVAACCCGVLLRRAVAACCCGVLLRRSVAACCVVYIQGIVDRWMVVARCRLWCCDNATVENVDIFLIAISIAYCIKHATSLPVTITGHYI